MIMKRKIKMNKEKYTKFKKDLKKYKRNLIKKAREKGLYENFGQKEINKLNEDYSLYCISLYEDFGKEINKSYKEFKDFCLNFDDRSLKEVFKK